MRIQSSQEAMDFTRSQIKTLGLPEAPAGSSKSTTVSPVIPAKKGESVKEYLKRVGGGKK